ncbi:MAG: methyltransferase domain-containing protein [Blastocatellia bacterium]
MSDKTKWDKRYDTTDVIGGSEPSSFLYSNAESLPTSGLALDLAAGQGRNSVFLAKRGLNTIALDISVRGLETGIRLARASRLQIEAAAVDLTKFSIPPKTFDVIINFNYLQRDLASAIILGLKPGGLLVFETMTTDYRRFKPDFNPDFLLRPGELVQMFRGLHLIKYRESILQTRAVASLMARKPEDGDCGLGFRSLE